MSLKKMTIHRALAELKLIDNKIEKLITNLDPVGMLIEGRLVNEIYKEEDFEKEVKSKYQSVSDLIKFKIKVKTALIKSNSETLVSISGESMTVADAITLKSSIDLKKSLHANLLTKFSKVRSKIGVHNEKIEDNALLLAKSALQKDNVKINDGDAIAITEPYMNKNLAHIVDPIDIKKEIDRLETEIEEFETNVDAVLSESNAITVIEV